MPVKNQNSSAYERIRDQALAASRQLHMEIRSCEAELAELREQERKISSLMGRPVNKATPGNGSRGRTDWSDVLAKCPKQFKASDVRKVRGLRDKQPNEIFSAITRWIAAKMVKRKDRGVYERVG